MHTEAEIAAVDRRIEQARRRMADGEGREHFTGIRVQATDIEGKAVETRLAPENLVLVDRRSAMAIDDQELYELIGVEMSSIYFATLPLLRL